MFIVAGIIILLGGGFAIGLILLLVGLISEAFKSTGR